MNKEELKEFFKLTKAIGLNKVEEIITFELREKREDETLFDALKRYYLEVFGE